jgi:RNA polymerase sigma-70 factor (ECF subfamily)
MQRLEADRERARLKRALLLLPDDKRELIVLARYQGLKYERIAELLGIEVGAVKVRIHRALRELRARFLQLSDRNLSCDAKRSTHTLQII